MGEYLRYHQEEEQPTPQQLNAELISALELLPKEELEDEATALEASGVIEIKNYFDYDYLVRKNRLNSGYGEMVMDHIAKLVERANITKHFKEYILDKFTGWLEQGITLSRDPKDIDQSLFFLERKNPESGGIFDPSRAKVLERKALEKETNLLNGFQGAVTLGHASQNKPVPTSWEEKLQRERKKLADWEVQINQHYDQ